MTAGPTSLHRRAPWVAVVLSMCQTGLGHLYAGQPVRALSWLVVSLVIGTATAAAVLWLHRSFLAALPALALWLAMIGDSGRVAARAPLDYQLRPYNRWYAYATVLLVGSWGGDMIRTAVRARVEAFRMPSGSMEPTLLIGDFFFVAKDARYRTDVPFGSIITYRTVDDTTVRAIKRVVGLPGDTLQMVAQVLHRNGRKVDEPYIMVGSDSADATYPEMAWQVRHVVGGPADYHPSVRNWGPLLVPPDSLFVLGDNRDNSYDSRYWGFLPKSHVYGQPTHIYFSYDKDAILPAFLTGIRWDRLAHPL